MSKKKKEAYELFLVEIPMLLDDLQELLKKSKKYKSVNLAFDYDTLEKIEKFYIDVLSRKEKIDISQERLDRIIIAYIGESLIEIAGKGRWYYNDFKNDPAYGLPVIIDYTDVEHLPFSPVHQRESIKEDKQPVLKERIHYCANKKEIEEDFFKEFE